MQQRPKLNIALTTADKLAEASGWLLLAGCWCLIGYHYRVLPDIIPIHFNAAGEADGFGSKSGIVALPTIATFLYTGLTFLNKVPHLFNYPVAITPENALQQYTSATKLIRYIKLAIVLIFGLLAYQTIQIAIKKADNLGIWLLPLCLAVLFIPIIIFLISTYRKKQ